MGQAGKSTLRTHPALILALSLVFILVPIGQPARAQPSPSSTPTSAADLTNTELPYLKRLQAANNLIKSTSYGEDFPAIIAAILIPNAEPTSRTILLRSLIQDGDPPPEAIKSVLWNALDSASDEDQLWLAVVLGRYSDPTLLASAMKTARDIDATARSRRGAILVLSQVRTREVAALLIDLLSGTDTPAIRQSASLALEQLTGGPPPGDDPQRWLEWWRDHKDLDELRWQHQLMSRFAAQSARSENTNRALINRLIETERHLYRSTTDSAEQENLLIAMIGDSRIEAIRELGLELTQKRHLDQQLIGEPLLRALLVALEDPAPAIRSRATVLLRLLDSSEAAALVARRLAEGVETHPMVLPSSVRMMARMPQSSAVARLLELLNNPVLRVDAAGALLRAYDTGLLGQQQLENVGRRVRNLVSTETSPPAPFVMLLGRVGRDEDWIRIEKWLDSDDPAVREAAANTWSLAGHDVDALLRRAQDPVIAPIAIGAAADHGDQPATFELLLKARPNVTTGTAAATADESWTRAVVAMAERVDPQGVISTVSAMPDDPATLELRERILNVLIARIEPPAAAATDQAPANGTDTTAAQPPMTKPMVAALLARAAIRLAGGEPREALRDLRRVQPQRDDLDAAQRTEHDKLMFLALLQIDETSEAFTHARRILADADSNANVDGDSPAGNSSQAPNAANAANASNAVMTQWIADTALAAADTAKAASQPARVDRIVGELRSLLGQPLPDPHAARAKALVQRQPSNDTSTDPATTIVETSNPAPGENGTEQPTSPQQQPQPANPGR